MKASRRAWGPWWGAARQSQVRKNLADHGGIFDGRQDRQGPAALGTGRDIDLEDAFESLLC